MIKKLHKVLLITPLLYAAATLPAASQDRSPDGMMDGGMMGFGMICMLLVAIFLALGIAALIKYLRSK